jgi:hypothetical protein
MAQYQKALALEPSYPTSHMYIGCCYRALSNYANAMDEKEQYALATTKEPWAFDKINVSLVAPGRRLPRLLKTHW